MIRHHFRIEPEELSDEKWAELYNDLLFVREQERNMLLGVFKQVISEAFGNKQS